MAVSSSSPARMALTKQADPATTRVANTGGTTASSFDFRKKRDGKHSTSPGPLARTLILGSSPLQAFEKLELGETAHTKAISGKREVTATVAVNIAVHARPLFGISIAARFLQLYVEWLKMKGRIRKRCPQHVFMVVMLILLWEDEGKENEKSWSCNELLV